MHKIELITGRVYHIFNKSIAGFQIFNTDFDYSRMQEVVRYYQVEKPHIKFSDYLSNHNVTKEIEICIEPKDNLVGIIAYCIMPTHIHLVLKQLKEKGISYFMSNILNSYTRYFNVKYKRKGPLWETRFKRVIVETDEQLSHLTRYIHLNPVTAYLVDKPHKWLFSSYREYIFNINDKERICRYSGVLDIKPELYMQFVEENISHQRELAKIKDLIIDQDPTYEVGKNQSGFHLRGGEG